MGAQARLTHLCCARLTLAPFLGKPPLAAMGVCASKATYHPTSDAVAFAHHMKSTQEKDLDQIMMDYTDESKVLLYDFSNGDGRPYHYHGLAEIRMYFAW